MHCVHYMHTYTALYVPTGSKVYLTREVRVRSNKRCTCTHNCALIYIKYPLCIHL